MTNFQITVNIDPTDLQILKGQGQSLYFFKAVQASGNGGITIWNKLENDSLMSTNTLTWTDDYQAFNSLSDIKKNVQILPGNTLPVKLGNIVLIDPSGNLSNTSEQYEGCISYVNSASKMYTVGYIQTKNVTCAFQINGGNSSRIMAPVNKVALIFTTDDLTIGTVIIKAMSSGILIDLNGAVNNSRAVNYKTADGWTSNTESWGENFAAFTDLPSLLIEAPDAVWAKQCRILSLRKY